MAMGQKNSHKFALLRKHKKATVELAKLNREIALRMIALAQETGEIEPLIDAVEALRSSEEYYFQDTVQIDTARVQKKLGDVLLNVGKNEDDMTAMEAAITAYRSAITIASMLGAHNLRLDARKSYALAMNYAGKGGRTQTVSLMGVA
jgi:predicted ATPase